METENPNSMKRPTGKVIRVQPYHSPCGELLLGEFDGKLCLSDWQVEKHRDHVDRRLQRILHARFEAGTSEVIDRAARQLDEYFAGKRKEFDVPLLFVGTDFQKAVWNELLKVPFGTTVSYAALSMRLGMPMVIRRKYGPGICRGRLVEQKSTHRSCVVLKGLPNLCFGQVFPFAFGQWDGESPTRSGSGGILFF